MVSISVLYAVYWYNEYVYQSIHSVYNTFQWCHLRGQIMTHTFFVLLKGHGSIVKAYEAGYKSKTPEVELMKGVRFAMY